jgi:hypothetical protein
LKVLFVNFSNFKNIIRTHFDTIPLPLAFAVVDNGNECPRLGTTFLAGAIWIVRGFFCLPRIDSTP